ncbi:kinase-like protein [Leucogyrophana mollusca]|uniref:Kinase-like protein n=1 Tax=Leucogyrophana mollusca TaxID=85980 RepID=A0ACB8B9R6_9AGAM|nr:kinase-like protein [Leucogyrophana mollusca]
MGDNGQALITDFGLSNVVEDLSDTATNKLGTSLLAGSTRWMAPELILALVEDDGRPPPITTSSDVYSFASVCLEVATGQIPYAHRRNDHAVTMDIMRGVKPSRAASSFLNLTDSDSDLFWGMLDRCWDTDWYMRPGMTEVTEILRGLVGVCS